MAFPRTDRRLCTLALLAVPALCPACSCEPYAGHVQMLAGEDGSVQVLSRCRDPEAEGGAYRYREFLYAVNDSAEWHTEPSSIGSGEGGFLTEKPYFLLADAMGRAFLVADLTRGLAIQVLDGGAWHTIDADPSLSKTAR